MSSCNRLSTNGDGWRLHDAILTPTNEQLQRYTVTLLNQQQPDPILTFRFPDGDLTFHKSYLTNASLPLKALLYSPFIESTNHTISLNYESVASFMVIRQFLYHIAIDMRNVPVELPLVADRWGLHLLFRAYLAFVQSCRWPCVEKFMNAVIPILQLPRLPVSFKRCVISVLVNNLGFLQSWICGPHPDDVTGIVARSGTCEEEYRECILWQALHKQRMIPRFIRYFKKRRTIDYVPFVSHGLYDILNRVIPEKHVRKIMYRAVTCSIPRLLASDKPGVTIWPRRVLCGGRQGIPLLPMYIRVLDHCEVVVPLPVRCGLNDVVKICALLTAKRGSEGEQDGRKSLSSSDYGD